jgi:hypothetical protein
MYLDRSQILADPKHLMPRNLYNPSSQSATIMIYMVLSTQVVTIYEIATS